jgi:hypothetical protein
MGSSLSRKLLKQLQSSFLKSLCFAGAYLFRYHCWEYHYLSFLYISAECLTSLLQYTIKTKRPLRPFLIILLMLRVGLDSIICLSVHGDRLIGDWINSVFICLTLSQYSPAATAVSYLTLYSFISILLFKAASLNCLVSSRFLDFVKSDPYQILQRCKSACFVVPNVFRIVLLPELSVLLDLLLLRISLWVCIHSIYRRLPWTRFDS